MHIPDGVLSPSTSVVAAAAMLPIWTLAARRVRATLGMRQIPLLSLGAAFCFTIMMFNIPALGGTTAHPVAGTLLAILLGPWAAVIGISVALGIQALFFGDGGLLAFGANCFTMAFALPFVGYSVYRLLARYQTDFAWGRAWAGAIGAYVGLNAAAALVALLLGIQPVLFHEPNGHALYFPFGLHITLPAMLGTHLLIAGPAEAIVTALVVRYLQAAGHSFYGEEKDRQGEALPNSTTVHISLSATEVTLQTGTSEGRLAKPPRRVRSLYPSHWNGIVPNSQSKIEALGIGLLALIALSPLGLLAKGSAWGEWDAVGVKAQIKKVDGREYVPQGIAQADEHAYKGIRGLQDYASNEGKNKLGYVGAGLLGVGTIAGLLLIAGRLLIGRTEPPATLDPDDDGDSDDKDNTPPGPRNGTPRPDPTSINTQPSTINRASTGSPEGHQPLPDWLRTPTPTDTPPDTSGRKPNPFLERTLTGLARNALDMLQAERWARQPGLLQQLDPRAKVAAFFALILVVTGLHRPLVLLSLYAFALVLAVLSHLPIALLLKRVWLSVPLFVGALILPVSLNLVTPGDSLLILWTHPLISLTRPGLALAAVLTLRVGVAVTLAALLTLSTRWSDLLRALRVLFVPRVFVSVLAMTYRYLAVLMQSADDLFVARRSRTVGRGSNAGGRRFVGTSMGALFGKTLALSEEVHGAMVSRGFNGDMRTLTPLLWRASDSLWMAAMVLVVVLCVGGEHVR